MSRPTTRLTPAAFALALDAVLVVGFAAIGRVSHESQPFGAGLLQTAWPFLAGLAIGWVITLAWRRPMAPVSTGLGVWVITVAGGMLLRTASGQGTALPFIIVATSTLLFLLVGWRLIAVAARKSAERRGRSD